MKKPLVAGIALIAGFAIATPVVAWSADQDQPQATEAPAGGHDMPGMGGQGMMGQGMMGQGMMGMMGGMREHGAMGPMGRHARMHGMGMRGTPAQRCEERLARRAGMIAYTVTKLNLTAEQRPLWDKLNGIVQSGIEKEQQLCAALKAQQPNQQTVVDRVQRREQFLNTELQTLQQARPALQQLYQQLSPEQKAIIDHPFRRG